MAVSEEMAAEFQALLGSLTPKQFQRMLERTLQVNNATCFQVQKEIVRAESGNGFHAQYAVRLTNPHDSEYFLQPDEKKS